MNAADPSRRCVPAWLWLWVPLAVFPLEVAAKAIDPGFFGRRVHGEYGVIENGTVLVLLAAIFCALRLFSLRERVAWRWFGPFALVMALGCFFFAGEEASWGQHWLGYETPEAIAERNDQGEFNLHNDPLLESVLDQLPRTLLTLAALIGGIVAPLVRRKRGIVGLDFSTPTPWGWIWPPIECLPTSVVALTVSLPKKFFRALDRELPELLDIGAGETKELCLALFLFVYLANLLGRLSARCEP